MADCDDGDRCTVDGCSAGVCTYAAAAGGTCGLGGTCGDGYCELTEVGAWHDVVAGYDMTCARATAGLYCWGANTKGQLGVGDKAGFSGSTAAMKVALDNVVRLTRGVQNTCARIGAPGTLGAEVYC